MAPRFLDLVNERVVVYDGATGTFLQGLDRTADDFGGPELEGFAYLAPDDHVKVQALNGLARMGAVDAAQAIVPLTASSTIQKPIDDGGLIVGASAWAS